MVPSFASVADANSAESEAGGRASKDGKSVNMMGDGWGETGSGPVIELSSPVLKASCSSTKVSPKTLVLEVSSEISSQQVF